MVLVVLLVLRTVLIVVRLDFMELIDIRRFDWRALLAVVRFGVGHCF